MARHVCANRTRLLNEVTRSLATNAVGICRQAGRGADGYCAVEHGSGLGRARWVVERTFAWLHHFKRLLVRYDRRAEIHEAFLALGCCLVCFRRLVRSV
jgi:Transposase DDE domain